MRIGLALPQFDFSAPGERPLRWATVLRWGQRAEELGFHSLWLADHLFWDLSRYGGPPEPGAAFDPLPALGALARVTAKPRLGTLVLCTPLRPPSSLAKAFATLDVLSGGRVVAGLGAGWYEPEFAASGVPFERPSVRLAHLAEYIEVLRALFGGGPVTVRGDRWWVLDAPSQPRPVQRPHPPIWVGGRGDALLRLVARHADGWNTVWLWTPEAYRERVAVLEAACERIGRDPSTVTRSLGLYALVGDDEADLRQRFERLQRLSPPGLLRGITLEDWRRGRLVGTVEEVREQVATWAELGVAELIVNSGAAPFVVGDDDDLAMIAEACSLGIPWEASELRN
ncbi:MAG: TIGR03619 family F420-dependent LLM class oxidoreductase [Actinomycetota bacterium]|nr:TIGR03619 family F420-dependent LLM class oxidoreductase [Actinomycetota bacterium]